MVKEKNRREIRKNFKLNENDMTTKFEMQIKQCLEGNINDFHKIKHQSLLKTFSKLGL